MYQNEEQIKNLSKQMWREFDFMAPYLRDEATIEIMLNPDGQVWVEQVGKPLFKIGDMSLYNANSLAATIAHSMGKIIDYSHPTLEGTLLITGARFEGFFPPVSAAPTFAIRKKPKKIFTLDDFKVSESQREVLRQWIEERKNLLIIGGTSSGKTQFANVMLDLMARFTPEDRIVILETLDELTCRSKNHSKLFETVDVTMNQLLRGVMRYRPDRIIVGEVVDACGHVLVKAWNTGHRGGFCTIHADSLNDGFERLYELIEESGIHMSDRVYKMMARAIDGVIFMKKTNGVRALHDMAEVKGFENGSFILEHIA